MWLGYGEDGPVTKVVVTTLMVQNSLRISFITFFSCSGSLGVGHAVLTKYYSVECLICVNGDNSFACAKQVHLALQAILFVICVLLLFPFGQAITWLQ